MTKKFPRRLLVVDDEPLIRWSIAETLKAHGDTVLEAENGAAALRAMRISLPRVDAVILDYRLPDTINLSLLAEMRRIAPTMPVIVMTALRHARCDRRRFTPRGVRRDGQALRAAPPRGCGFAGPATWIGGGSAGRIEP